MLVIIMCILSGKIFVTAAKSIWASAVVARAVRKHEGVVAVLRCVLWWCLLPLLIIIIGIVVTIVYNSPTTTTGSLLLSNCVVV